MIFSVKFNNLPVSKLMKFLYLNYFFSHNLNHIQRSSYNFFVSVMYYIFPVGRPSSKALNASSLYFVVDYI